jgi:hypothetical protein
MASNDMQKYLDQDGVATLWSRVVEKIEEEGLSTKQLSESNASNIATIQNQIKTLQDEAYDDTEVRRLISNNLTKINAHIDTTNTLQGDVNTEGSVRNIATAIAAAEIAKVVANANSDFDTLKEIADWILNDTTGAADMANDIAALQNLIGNTKVATQISNAITSALKTNGVDKYALATELTSLANRVQTLEKSGFMNAAAVDSAIDAKVNALKLASTYEAKGAAATALTNAKAYSDANLAILKTYADTNKVDIAKPEFKTNTIVYRNVDGNTAAVLNVEDLNAVLYLGIDGPLTLTEEEMREYGWSEEEIIRYTNIYGNTTHPCMGSLALFDGQGGVSYLGPNPDADYATYTLPYESGTLVTGEELMEFFESPYFATLITNALGVYTGGDY